MDVETKQLSRALGRVAADKTLELIHLKYNWGSLRIWAAGTAVDIKAAGSWPDVVSIERTAALASYRVTAAEIEELLNEASPENARLWGPNDGRVIEDVAKAWNCLAAHGVETSAIRRLIDRKTRESFKSPVVPL